MTTRDIATLLFNNVYLFNGTPDQCCTLGFHSYDLEPGDAIEVLQPGLRAGAQRPPLSRPERGDAAVVRVRVAVIGALGSVQLPGRDDAAVALARTAVAWM
jgi:hypothetical protein